MSNGHKSPPLRPVIYLLKQVQNALRSALDEALTQVDLTASQADVLSALAYVPHLSNAELARVSFVTPQSMVELLKSLEARGFVVRRPHPAGGRAMPAELTRQGAKQLMMVRLAMRELEDRLLRGVTSEDRTRLRVMLEHCLASLRSERSDR
jgi:DNA-binding MarR family transcriptional regulator